MRKPFTNWRLLTWATCILGFLLPKLASAQAATDTKRYAIYTSYMPGDDTGDATIYDSNYAIDNGCNAVEIGVRWGELFPSPTATPRWAKVDKIVAALQAKGVKIAFRLCVSRKSPGYWTDDQKMRDTRGNMIDLGGDNQFRFGHTPSVNKSIEFIRSFVQRYQYLNQSGQLLFVSVVTNPQLESEFFMSNYPLDGSPSYATMYDYSEATIADFQRWAMQKYGNNLTTLNQKWGSNFASASAITPPYPNSSNLNAFSGTRGLDWYAFRHATFKAYLDLCNQTIKSVDNTIRVINQHGSVHDPNCGIRGTYGFKSLAEFADGIKVNDSPWWPFQYSMDVIRSNIKPGGWMINELDGMFSGTSSDVDGLLKDQVEQSFKYGANAINLANFAYFSSSNQNKAYLKSILDYIKARGLLNSPVTIITPEKTVSYKLSRVVQSNIHEIGLTGDWNNARGSTNKPVKIILDEDILPTTASAPTNQAPVVANAVPNQDAVLGKAYSYRIPDNTFSDADGTIASVAVTNLPGGMSYNATTRTISGTATAVESKNVTITATDDQGATVSNVFVLAVRQAASPLRLLDPVLTCTTGKLEFRTADGDGTSVEYKLNGITDWSTSTSITLDDRYRSGTALNVQARQNGTVFSLTYTTTCASTNRPPVVASQLPDKSVATNQYLSFIIPASTFSDPDGTIVSISVSGLPPGLNYEASSRTVDGVISASSSWTVIVTATDDKGATVTDDFIVSTNSSIKPLRMLTPTLDCNTGRFEMRTADGDGTTIQYTMDRVFDWTSEPVQTLSETVRQNDQLHFRAWQSGVVVYGVYTPNCPPPNKMPVLANAIPAQNWTQYRNVAFTIPTNTFSDSDGTIAKISVTGLPAGLTYDASKQTINGAATGAGNWTISVTATDDRDGTVSTTFVITVVSGTKPLRMVAPTMACNTGRLEFKTADGDGTTIQYSIDGILNWTTQNTYTLATALRYNSNLTIRARQGATEVSTTFLTSCPRTNLPPVVDNRISNQVLTVNQAATIAIPANTFSDPDGQVVSVTVSGLPVGLAYDPAKRVIAGTPTLIGASSVLVKATDNLGASVVDTFLLTVRSAPRFAATVSMLDAQNKVVRAINEGDLIDIQKIPTLVNLNCVPKTTSGSVQMELSGKTRQTTYANASPYQLYPSAQGFKPEIGSYQLKVTAYSGANGTGTQLGTTTIRFDIVATSEPGGAGPGATEK